MTTSAPRAPSHASASRFPAALAASARVRRARSGPTRWRSRGSAFGPANERMASATSKRSRTTTASHVGFRPSLFFALTSAPWCRRVATVSGPAMRAARSSGVSSAWSGASIQQPSRAHSTAHVSARSCMAAKCSAVRPSASSSFGSTPWSHRSATTSAWPPAAAKNRGRIPRLSLTFVVAPAAMSAATSSARPRWHAVRSASARCFSSSASWRCASIAAREGGERARLTAPGGRAAVAKRAVASYMPGSEKRRARTLVSSSRDIF